MKILYAIQGTGNGHLTRAMEIVPVLKTKGDVEVLISGIQADLPLPFHVDHRLKGLSFIFGKHGGVDIWNTYMKLNSLRLLSEVRSLDVKGYDLVISDFEPVSAWACNLAKKPCIGMSNQIATLHPRAPRPKKVDPLGHMILEKYAPTTFQYGFHFKRLDHNIYTPIIRKEVREKKVENKGHYTVYLPSYGKEKILKNLGNFRKIDWQVFSKHHQKPIQHKNIKIFPLNKELFLDSMATSAGVLCNAGFSTASEALFLNKKLMVIPMKSQYEQWCNAAMLKSMGVNVMKKLKAKYSEKLKEWLENDSIIEVNYPDETEQILDTIIENHAGKEIDHFAENSEYPIFQ